MSGPPLLVAGLALATGLAAGWFAVPRPPALEGERWFKTLLARRLRRDPEDAWRADVRRFVPFHPLGRVVEQQLARPSTATLPGGPSEAERAWLAELAALPTVAARWARLGRDADAALLAPDRPLSADHTVRRWLGPAWEDRPLAEVAAEAEARLHARWVVVTGTPRADVPDLAAALATFAQRFEVAAADPEAASGPLAEALKALFPADDRVARLVVAAVGDAVPTVLRALAADMALRDRVIAVVAVGGVVQGVPDAPGPLGWAAVQDWLGHHFRHEALDVELVRLVPYVSLGWIDPAVSPPGLPELPIDVQRFPEAGFVGREPPCVEPVDLGVLPATPELPTAAVADALRVLVDLWTTSRR